jgi:hypothetical protein
VEVDEGAGEPVRDEAAHGPLLAAELRALGQRDVEGAQRADVHAPADELRDDQQLQAPDQAHLEDEEEAGEVEGEWWRERTMGSGGGEGRNERARM